MLDKELVDTLGAYLEQKITCNTLSEWLAGIDLAQPSLSDEDEEALTTVRLLCIEMEEGMRTEEDVRQCALELLRESSMALSFAFGATPTYKVSATATAITKQEKEWSPSIAWVVRSGGEVYA